ncbi:MAG: hypothetical protein RL219_446 [Actinomycetota bacterium]
MIELAEHIAAAWGDWEGPVVETWIFGSREPTRIASEIETWVQRCLGASIAEVHGYHASVGATALLLLTDGSDVAVKVHQPRFTVSYLQSAHAVHEHLYRSRFPCPQPLVGPSPCGLGWATAARRVPSLEQAAPDAIAALATLARLTLYCDSLDRFGIDVSHLWPHPLGMRAQDASFADAHHPALVGRGSAAVTRLAQQLMVGARRVLDADTGEPVVTHSDWSPRNVRGDSSGVSIVLDMDSLTLASDAQAAGSAAAQWAVDASSTAAVSVAEIDEVGSLYRRVRDVPFGQRERAVFRAAALERLCRLAAIEDASGMHGVAVESLHAIGVELAGGAESA